MSVVENSVCGGEKVSMVENSVCVWKTYVCGGKIFCGDKMSVAGNMFVVGKPMSVLRNWRLWWETDVWGGKKMSGVGNRCLGWKTNDTNRNCADYFQFHTNTQCQCCWNYSYSADKFTWPSYENDLVKSTWNSLWEQVICNTSPVCCYGNCFRCSASCYSTCAMAGIKEMRQEG